MNDIRTVKLTAVGEKITFTCDRVTFNPKSDKIKYPDFTFVGVVAGERIRVNVPEAATRRQAERFKLAPEQFEGQTITISRSASSDPDKPYWNIDLAAPHEAKAKPEPKRMTEAEAQTPVKDLEKGSDGTAVPGDAPPKRISELEPVTTADVGLPEQLLLVENAGNPGESGKAPSIKAQKVDQVDRAVAHAWAKAHEIQGAKGTADSLQAMTATLVIQYERVGVFR